MKLHLPPRRGVTLIEMMVVIAVLGVLLAVAAPSVRKLIEVQRMRGLSAGLTTDLQFARTEAAARQEVAGISFTYQAGTQSCYTVHTCGSASIAACTCDCTAAPGNRCPVGQPDPPREVKTVTVPATLGVMLAPTNASGSVFPSAKVLFDPATGSLSSDYPSGITLPPAPPDGSFIGTTKLVAPAQAVGAIRTEVSLAGRPRTCPGVAPC